MWDTGSADVGIHGRALAAASAVLLLAVVAQVSLVARLSLPFDGRPDLVLVLLAAVALVEGPTAGALLGFGVGVFGDLLSSHVLGQGAVVLCLVGYASGLVAAAAERSVRVPLVVVGLACALGTLGHAAFAAILGGSALTGGQALARAAAAALYGLLVTPFLYPLVLGAAHRLQGERP